MGIESDQLVFDYLSRVGDLAQQRQLPSGTRMRLVSELRNEIDRSRAKATADTPAAVRRLLERLGTPEELVEAAGSGDVPKKTARRPAVPTQRTSEPQDRPKRLRRMVPRPRPAAEQEKPEVPDEDFRPSPPHLASTDELGDPGSEPDWWRVEGGGSGPFGIADSVPGFTGGVEIPDILKPPQKKRIEEEEDDEDEEEWEEEEEDEEEEVGARQRRRPRVRRPVAKAASAARGFSNPLLLLAAALLTVGAILGNLLAMGGGWLLAYASRRLSRAEAKWAVIGLPGLSLAAGITWLWGRSQGRWGDPVRDGQMSGAIADTWPWVVRGAAVASALYLLWRSQRQRP